MSFKCDTESMKQNTRGCPKDDWTLTSRCCRFSARFTLDRRPGFAGLCGKIVGIASGLSAFFLRLDPINWSSIRYDSSKQERSKCFEQTRGSFGKVVLLTAFTHARYNSGFSGKQWKRTEGSSFFFAWLLQPTTTQCGILLRQGSEPASPATVTRHQPIVLCTFIQRWRPREFQIAPESHFRRQKTTE